ncbi:MAG: efflux RND transporter permease subunit, partial [Cyanobacteria bacterium P01_A01_bin.83]
RSLLGTKQVELYGTPTEEIAVTVSPQRLNAFDSLDRFEAELSQGVDLQIIFNQSIYVEAQLSLVINNLIMAGFLVVVVTFFMMGWKSSLIVGLALPLATFTVFGCMQVLQIPLHNTSITGVIIALGLLIDNAIIKDQKLFVNKR